MSLGFLLTACVALAWTGAHLVRRNAARLGLVALPNSRSSHTLPTPGGGGIGIVLSATLAGSWLTWGGPWPLAAMVGLGLPLALVGLADDIRPRSARLRFAVQAAVCGGFLLMLGDLPPAELDGVLALGGGPLLTVLMLTGLWWINLFNFMDGIDGLAGGQALFMLLAGAGLALWRSDAVATDPVWMLMLCCAAAVFGFLLLNWPPARIFMGDVGSTWLAFMLFALALLSVQSGWLNYAAWLVLAAVFVTDATVTLLTRLARGERWYQAHRSHAYQRLSRRTGDRRRGHGRVTLLATSINLLWLLPLAAACLIRPHLALLWCILAYAPLVGAVVLAGAGRPDNDDRK